MHLSAVGVAGSPGTGGWVRVGLMELTDRVGTAVPAPGVPEATGRRVVRSGQEWLVHTRHAVADRTVVWAALTRRDQLARWVGTWRPLPDSAVEFQMTFEGGDPMPVVYRVDACSVGRSFSASLLRPETAEPADVAVELTPAGVGVRAGTLITMAHSVRNRALAPHLAAGCEYYLDRFVELVEGVDRRGPAGPAYPACPAGSGDPATPDFDEYFVAHAGHYRRLFPLQRQSWPGG